MKTLNELYKLLKSKLPREHFYICNEISALHYKGWITIREHKKILVHFRRQRPTPEKHVEFYNVDTYKKGERSLNDSWWLGDGEQRHLFIDKMIKITTRK